MRSLLVLAGFLAAAFAAAGIGGWATAGSVREWYPTLVKPSWNPPSWVFGPVWTTLYTAMAVAAWRVWRGREGRSETGCTLRLWWAQLVLNTAWSPAFFGLREPAAGLAVILPLLSLLGWMQVRLVRSDRVAALLWAPYVLWVGFATVLNFTLWRLN